MQERSAAIRWALIPVLAITVSACRTHPEDVGVASPQPVAIVTPSGYVVPVPGDIATAHPKLVAAYRTRDLASMRPFFTDNTVLIMPQGRFTGWTEIQPQLAGMADFQLVPTSFTREGDIIVERGQVTYRLVPGSGLPQTVNTTYVQSWHPQAGGQIGTMTIGNTTTGN